MSEPFARVAVNRKVAVKFSQDYWSGWIEVPAPVKARKEGKK